MRYEDWLSEWLENYVKPTAKERTYERYVQVVELHICPRLGEYETGEITPIILQSFVRELTTSGNKRTGKGLSPGFANLVISVVKGSLKTAFALGITERFTADKVQRPKSETRRVECFSPTEQKRIERYCLESKRDKLFGVVLCLYTGLRIGELLALTWNDIDLDKGLLTVGKTCHDGSAGGKHCRITDTPKTRTSNRVIPIPKQLLPRLKELKKRNRSEYVVSDEKRIVYVRSYQKMFADLLKKLNIPHKGFHALRHTFATRAIECGMDVKSLSEILGHKNATVTLNRYTHSLMEHKAEMMNRLGKLL